MKKTSVIILTLVASLSISLGSAQNNSPNPVPPDFLYDSEAVQSDTVRRDTVRSDPSGYYNYQQTNVYYGYYYRSRFFNSLFRVFLPGRYHRLISQPGFAPRHVRQAHGDVQQATGKRSGRSSRGGFGHLGATHSQFN